MTHLAKIRLAFVRTQHRSLTSRSIFSSPDCQAVAVDAADERNAAAYGAGWDAGGTAVKIGVWWDFENCNVPYGIDAHRVGLNIVSGLRSSGFKGPVSISGYGDMLQLSRSVQENLSATGIRLHHVPSGGKESESSDRALLMDLILWTIENPPPAHLFLISGDRDFSTALHKLRMRNYNVLLACPAGAYISPSLLGAASRVWYWNSLVRGEALVAATSWSIDGPAPKPILPPLLKTPASPSPSGSSQVDSCSKSNQQHKIPYFCTPPLSCPPVPPPFSCSSSSSSSSAPFQSILPPLPPSETASSISPYSVSSPNFPSVSSAPLSPSVSSSSQPAAPQVSVSTTKSQPVVAPTKFSETVSSKANSVSVKPVKPAPETKFAEKVNKTESISDVLGRLDTLLKAHPKGLWLGDLQAHMLSRKIQFDSDFYGHKKLVPYLLTLPRLARVERQLMKDNKTWSYLFFPSTAPASEMKSSKRAEYPMEVLCQLNDLFRQHPKGIWLAELHAELVARNIRLEPNFYGHAKIVPFLLSLPQMVKIERRYVSDRWSYFFLWNEEGSSKLELMGTVYRKPLPVKRGIVISAAKLQGETPKIGEADEHKEGPFLQDTESGGATIFKNAEAVKQEIPPEVKADGSEKHDSVSNEPFVDRADGSASAKEDCALVAVEEHTVTLYSWLSASVSGFFRKMCRRWLSPRDKVEVLCIENGPVNVTVENTSPVRPAQHEQTDLEASRKELPQQKLARRNRRPSKRAKAPTRKLVRKAVGSEVRQEVSDPQETTEILEKEQEVADPQETTEVLATEQEVAEPQETTEEKVSTLELSEQQAFAGQGASSMHVTSVYNYSEEHLLEDEVTILIEQDRRQGEEVFLAEEDILSCGTEDIISGVALAGDTTNTRQEEEAFQDNQNISSRRIDFGMTLADDNTTAEAGRETNTQRAVTDEHQAPEQLKMQQLSVNYEQAACTIDLGTTEQNDGGREKLVEEATGKTPSMEVWPTAVYEVANESKPPEQSIDTDKVLKLFQCFTGDSGAKTQTPADDLANKVLDLLERSIKADRPGFKGRSSTRASDQSLHVRRMVDIGRKECQTIKDEGQELETKTEIDLAKAADIHDSIQQNSNKVCALEAPPKPPRQYKTKTRAVPEVNLAPLGTLETPKEIQDPSPAAGLQLNVVDTAWPPDTPKKRKPRTKAGKNIETQRSISNNKVVGEITSAIGKEEGDDAAKPPKRPYKKKGIKLPPRGQF